MWFIKLFDDARHFRPQPFDFLVLTREENVAIECKLVGEKSFPFSRLSEHQVDGLLNFEKHLPQNFGYVLVNFRNKERGKKRINETYALNIQTFLHMKSTLKRKSIPIETFRNQVFKVKKLPKSRWKIE